MKTAFFVAVISIVCIISACQKEKIGTGTNIQDLFYLENQGAKMPILVEGNINSGVILLWVHGGPGGTAIGFQNDENISTRLEPQYAMAYMDQRAAGVSQGNTPARATVESKLAAAGLDVEIMVEAAV